MSNTDVSRLLGEMWRSASPTEKKPYVDEEVIERAKYKEEIKKFRENLAKQDAASRTSHHSVQKVAAEKPRQKQPRTQQHARVFIDPSAATTFAPQPHRTFAASSGPADRRVFRPYSGGPPIEAQPYYKIEQHMVHPTYDHDEVIPPPPSQNKVERPMFRAPKPSPTQSRPFEAVSVDDGKLEANFYRHQQLQQPYRPSYHLPESHHHVASLNHTGSDISQIEEFNIDGNLNPQESFVEPDPPFNPRQQRPAASHYFTESFYKYP